METQFETRITSIEPSWDIRRLGRVECDLYIKEEWVEKWRPSGFAGVARPQTTYCPKFCLAIGNGTRKCTGLKRRSQGN